MVTPTSKPYGLAALSSLFFAWGFITCLNDILIPHLRSVFSLSYAQGALVQSAFFLAYFCGSLPAGAVIAKFGYKRSVVYGLATMALGAFLFVPAGAAASFPAFLLALFVLALGITLLQVAANPYVTLLGPASTAPARLNLTQAFNSLGTTVAPAIGGMLLLGSAGAESVRGPYLVIAAFLLLMAGFFYRMPLPEPELSREKSSFKAMRQAAAKPHLSRAVLGIFLYVGAEVAIGSFLVNFIVSAAPVGERAAALYVSLYWGAAMVGRFVGSALMQKVPPGAMLGAAATGAVGLITLALNTNGYLSIYALLAVGLCNSIMFPTIFALGVRGLGTLTSVGSSLLIMAIVGGATVPLVMGAGADAFGLKTALLVPAVCYAYIAYFGWRGSNVAQAAAETEARGRWPHAEAVGGELAAETVG